MFTNRFKTVLQKAIDTTKREFIEHYDTNSITDNVNNFLKDGAPLIKCYPNSDAVNHLMTKGVFVDHPEIEMENSDNNKIVPIECDTLQHELTQSVINIKNAGTLKNCISMLHDISNSLGNKLYGALLIDDKTILNPFHPVTAILLADEEKYKELHLGNYRIAVYGYNSDEIYNELHNLYKSDLANIEVISQNIDKLIQASAHQVNTEIQIIDSENASSESITIVYQISKFANEAPDYEFYLSAHQMLTKGIVLPYYGSSFVKMNGATVGMAVSPMATCNISSPKEYHEKSHLLDAPRWSSVCTGSIPSGTIKGVRTLNHANLLSPFTRNIIYPGALVYAQVSIIKSLQIYKSAGFITGEINENYYIPTKSE